ncbi:ubiquitin protein ligase protein, partial [Trichomonas vaginalis G3]|uniref:ubiquitin protein ligase protein n=1 Tax=Trichomonas vaginalis (strain ATCC PRA-98 / G3) TaxID=412133 RepID=UPI0021E5E08F
MDKFFRPSPFNGEVKTYPKEYADLIENPESYQKQLINIIKAKSKSIEEYYPSISQMYDNLILVLKDKYDKIIETYVRFETNPVAGQENLYMDNISLKFEGDYITIKNVNAKCLFRLLETYFKQINENEYHYLVKFGLSPSSYPLSKLSIISNLIDARKSFRIGGTSEIITKDIINEEGELKKCINDVVCSLQKIENHPIEKWNKSDEIGNLIRNAANKAICINSLNGSYIVFQNSEQRYTIDIKSQKIITNEGTVDVSSIYPFNIINAAIINGCLTLIGIKDSEVCIIQYKDDKMKKLGECEYTLVGTGIKLLNSEFCCHIIYNELHLYTNDHKIVIYNLIDKKIIDQSPQFYLFSYENFSCNQIYCVTFDNENTLYVDRRKIETLDNYVTLIRPSYANESYQAISMIADDIMADITKTFINIIV